MERVFEYRSAPGKGAIWIAVIGLGVLLLVVVIMGADHLIPLVWVVGAVSVAWMAQPRPIYGMRVDSTHLTLAAWRKPRQIRLEEIDHLRATGVSDETHVAIVYKNNAEEAVFAGDLPDIEILIAVMGERGVPVRGYF